MHLALAQIRPFAGDVPSNLHKHELFINSAIKSGVHAIFFSELSLTGYEPALAADLAMTPDDERLTIFQQLSERHQLLIGIGLPLQSPTRLPYISLLLFQPYQPPILYTKQYLHPDEEAYFTPGHTPLVLDWHGTRISPAICFESLLPEHGHHAYQLGAQIYIACTAKSKLGLDRALNYYPMLARKYHMPVLLSNCIGPCDNFVSGGNTGVCNRQGEWIGMLDDIQEGLLIYDNTAEKIIQCMNEDDIYKKTNQKA